MDFFGIHTVHQVHINPTICWGHCDSFFQGGHLQQCNAFQLHRASVFVDSLVTSLYHWWKMLNVQTVHFHGHADFFCPALWNIYNGSSVSSLVHTATQQATGTHTQLWWRKQHIWKEGNGWLTWPPTPHVHTTNVFLFVCVGVCVRLHARTRFYDVSVICSALVSAANINSLLILARL